MSKDDKPRVKGEAAAKPATKPKRTRKTLVRKTRYMALEPRIVFDGALAADIVDKTTQAADASKPADSAPAEKTLPAVDWTQTRVPAATTADGKPVPDAAAADKAAADKSAIDDRLLPAERGFSSDRTEIIFVDTTVRDFQVLLQGISPSTRVVMLDSARDAVAQIASALSQYEAGKVDAVHLITHGNEGQIDFGSGVLNATTMRTTYAADLAKIGEKLSEDADILVYGCEFGKGEVGRNAAQILTELTGADVAASTNATGDAALGGDWSLELHQGKIETDIVVDRLAQEAWHDLLAVHTLDFDTAPSWTAGQTSQSFTVDGYPVTISYGAALNQDPVIASDRSGGVVPAQDAIQFMLGSSAATEITIDFSGQPGGTVSNVGFALYDVDGGEVATFTGYQGATQIAPTNVATSAMNSVTASSSTSVTVTGTAGSNALGTSADGNAYVYYNVAGLTSVKFTYSGTANYTLVILSDITFFGASSNPPVVDLDSSSGTTVTAGDNFATQVYNNTTAGSTLPWAAGWVETDATSGGSTTAGQVQVVDTPTSGTDFGLRLNNSGTAAQFTGATRQIDLSAVSNSNLEFDYITSGALTSADAVVLEVSTNGGVNWTTLKTYTGSSPSSTNYTHDSVSIAGYESASTVIRFRVSGTAAYTAATDFFFVDNVSMTALPTGSSNAYTEGDATGVRIAAAMNATVTDTDSTTMSSAKATIASVAAGDVLDVAGGVLDGTTKILGTNISGTYDAGTGVLTLSGTDSKANYATVINAIRYKNTGDDPTVGGTRGTRSIGVMVRDSGFNEGNTATSLITISAQNDGPTNALAASYSTNEDTPLTLSGLSVSDPDAGTGTMTVTLSVTSGTLSATSGGSVTVTGSGTGSIVLSGTLANINARLAGVAPTFSPAANASGTVTLTMLTSDGGNTGSGGALTDSDTRTITVAPVNDAPILGAISKAGTEDTTVTFSAADFTGAYSDVEGTAVASFTIATLPSTGTLKLSGVAVTAGQVISPANLANLTYEPAWDPLESTCRHASLSIL